MRNKLKKLHPKKSSSYQTLSLSLPSPWSLALSLLAQKLTYQSSSNKRLLS